MDHGIQGINYYWVRREMYNLSIEELNNVGVFDEHAYVREEVIPALKNAQEFLLKQGFDLIVKDSYRSPELYNLVYQKRVQQHGKEETDRILNVVDMPHATGFAVDVNLINLQTHQEILLRNKTHGTDAFFVDYYKNSPLEEEKEFHRLQKLLAQSMLEHGFRYGKKMEFWHFEFNQDQ